MFLGACLRAMPGSPARKKPPPRRYPAHSGRHPARQTGTGHAAEAQGIPDQTSTARWTKPGTRPGWWCAAGSSRVERLGYAIGQPPRPARKNLRRAVHPAQRGTCRHACSARRRHSPARPGNPARWTKPGTGPGWWRAAGCSRVDRLGSAIGRTATASAKEPPPRRTPGAAWKPSAWPGQSS